VAADFGTVLDECLVRLEAGVELDACLAEHPEYAADLSALLSVAASLQSLARPEPRPEAVSAGRAQMLSAARARKQAQAVPAQPVPRYSRWLDAVFGKPAGARPTLRFALGLLLMLVLGANLVWVASAAATLPGDGLYPIKRALENTRLALTPGEQAREQFEEQMAARRQHEVQQMFELDRQGQIEILGTLQPEGNDRWVIGGLSVDIDQATAIDGKLSAGVLADAQVAIMRGRRILALTVHVLPAPVVPFTDPTPAASRRPSPLHTAGLRGVEPIAEEPTTWSPTLAPAAIEPTVAPPTTAALATAAPVSQRSDPAEPSEMPGQADGAKPSEAPPQKFEPAASEEVQAAPSSDRQPESTPAPVNDSHAQGTEAIDKIHAPDRRPDNLPAPKEQAKATPGNSVDHTSPQPAQSDQVQPAPVEAGHDSEPTHLRPVMPGTVAGTVERENSAKPAVKPLADGGRRDTWPQKAERPKASHD
jgi:hypothetical protein